MFQFKPTIISTLPDIDYKGNINRLQGISIGDQLVSVVSSSYRLFQDEAIILAVEEAMREAGITGMKQYHHVCSEPLTKNIYYYRGMRGRTITMQGPDIKLTRSIIIENSYNRESAYKVYAGVYIGELITPLVFRFAAGNARMIHMGNLDIDMDFTFLKNIKKFELIMKLSELIFINIRHYREGLVDLEDGRYFTLPTRRLSDGLQQDIEFHSNFVGHGSDELDHVTTLSDIIVAMADILGRKGIYTGYNLQSTMPMKDLFDIEKLRAMCEHSNQSNFEDLVTASDFANEQEPTEQEIPF